MRLPRRGGGAPESPADDSELVRVRGALARGTELTEALDRQADATTGLDGLELLGQRVSAEVRGAGPLLQPLLETSGVTDVLVGGGTTWIDRGHGLEEVPEAHLDEEDARALAVRMAASCGRRLDDASPVVDATLPGGVRLNAVLPPLSADGTLICLRTSPPQALRLEDLVAAGTLSPGLDLVLAALVGRHASCLVTGATGSGKTTLLAALLSLVSPEERIVCIEEAAELRPNHPHVIHLQERSSNVQGVGAVPMTTLVRTALRMRPDRIVLGECRGPEVRDVLTALNTGHDGGWATLHANSPADVPARLTALGALAGLDEAAVAAQAVSALDAVVHLRRGEAGVRQVVALGVLQRDGSGRLQCREALALGDGGRLAAGPGAERLGRLVGGEAMTAALGQVGQSAPPERWRQAATVLGEGAP